MSRSGYIDGLGDDDPLAYGRWRGIVASAMRGKRGQALLKEMLAALDAMPKKRLIAKELEDGEFGGVCALGAAGRARGMNMAPIDPDDHDTVAAAFGIATPMAQEIMHINDEHGPHNETPEQRFIRMRKWIESQIKKDDMPGRAKA